MSPREKNGPTPPTPGARRMRASGSRAARRSSNARGSVSGRVILPVMNRPLTHPLLLAASQPRWRAVSIRWEAGSWRAAASGKVAASHQVPPH
jgi:hypothetical protein